MPTRWDQCWFGKGKGCNLKVVTYSTSNGMQWPQSQPLPLFWLQLSQFGSNDLGPTQTIPILLLLAVCAFATPPLPTFLLHKRTQGQQEQSLTAPLISLKWASFEVGGVTAWKCWRGWWEGLLENERKGEIWNILGLIITYLRGRSARDNKGHPAVVVIVGALKWGSALRGLIVSKAATLSL